MIDRTRVVTVIGYAHKDERVVATYTMSVPEDQQYPVCNIIVNSLHESLSFRQLVKIATSGFLYRYGDEFKIDSWMLPLEDCLR